MTSRDVTAGRLETARHCLETLCNDCYRKGGEGGLDNDDIMLINLSDIVFEALNCVAGNTPFSLDRLYEICDTSLQETPMDKFAYAFSILLQLLFRGREEESPPENQLSGSAEDGNGPMPATLFADANVKEEPIDDVVDPAGVDVKEELEDDYEDMEQDLAGPSQRAEYLYGYTAALSYDDDDADGNGRRQPTKKQIWTKPAGSSRSDPPVKCNHCVEYAVPGHEMVSHMAECHPEVLPKLCKKYGELSRQKQPSAKQMKMSAELQEQYSNYSNRYLPKFTKMKTKDGKKIVKKAPPQTTTGTSQERGRRERKDASKKTSRPCSHCRCHIADSTRRDEHTRKEHPMEWLRVPKCSEPACDYRSLEPILREKHEEAFYKQHAVMSSFLFYPGTKCPHCPASLLTLADYNSHMEQKHPLQHISSLNILRCAACAGKFSRITALANHWVISSCPPVIEFDEFAIERCNKRFVSSAKNLRIATLLLRVVRQPQIFLKTLSSMSSKSISDSIAILASQSPERLNLLSQIGLNPTVIVSNFDENLSKDLPVEEFVLQTAIGKLQVVIDDVVRDKTPFDFIIAADTVIHFENEIIGKPRDDEDARRTIQRLSDKFHDVYTGLAIHFADGSTSHVVEKTVVRFRNLPQGTIDSYIASGEHRGKAGSYGIRKRGSVLVKGIEGCFFNIVGMPIGRLCEELERKGFSL
ncbi:dod-18 [Pristionchus pacificus]|uniref:Dod-18 n=1 Tax=Pristionchus pacificus TaxID=54126 RepID=A0A2A6B924_PRIPA|nr:dod-18 [Pristionchus pacificus]|eukprot:PDM62392.1 dod-18 [Pristionchus pacificus]